MRKKRKIKSVTLRSLNDKLDHIHEDVEKNSKDISKIQQEIAFGKGGVRVLVWIIGIDTAILGYFNFK